MACACVALVVMAFATRSWMICAIMPVFALGGIGAPALQSLATRQVSDDRQGRFQGALARRRLVVGDRRICGAGAARAGLAPGQAGSTAGTLACCCIKPPAPGAILFGHGCQCWRCKDLPLANPCLVTQAWCLRLRMRRKPSMPRPMPSIMYVPGSGTAEVMFTVSMPMKLELLPFGPPSPTR